MSKTLTANFITEKNKTAGAEIRTLLEIDAISGTLYYSDQPLTVSGQPYTANVMAWPNRIVSQNRPGEEVVRTSTARFEINNNPRIDSDIRPGAEIRLYLWFEGLTSADKLLWFKGVVNENIEITAYRVRFTAMDIGDWFDKQIGVPLSSATYPNADPDDIGKIQPILYGNLTNQPCLAIVAGAVSTLVNDISAGASSVELSDASAFPNSGTLIIGDEEDITYSGKSTNTLTGVANVSFDYPRATRVMEKIAQLEYMVASHPVKAITNPRILPWGLRVEDAVRVDSGDFTATIDDGGIATVDITEIANVKKAVEVAVTQQPDQPITTQPNQPITTQPVFGTTSVVTIERHATGISLNNNFTNPTNAFDFDDATFSNSSTGSGGALRLSFSTTSLGTISEVRAVVRSAVSPDKSPTITVGSGQTFPMTVGLATRKFVTNITTFAQLSTLMVSYSSGAAPIGAIDAYEMYYEVDYIPAVTRTTDSVSNRTTNSISNRITDVVVGGNSVADTLGGILIVDCEGQPDDNPAHYTDVADSLIEEPWDVTHHLLENYGNGITDSDIDLAGSFQDAEDNLPASYAFAFSIRQKINLNRLIAMLAQQTWCRFIWEAGIAKLNRIKESGTSIKAIDTDTDSYVSSDRRLQVTKRSRSLSEIYNDIEVKYNLNYTLGNWGVPDAYNGSSEDTDSNSIAAYKTRQRTWLMFGIANNSAMADDVRGKILDFYKNPKPTFSFSTWLKHVELERGDIPDLTVTQLGAFGRVCEIIGVDYQPPWPNRRQRPELTFSLLDLAVIIEELFLQFDATITVEDIHDQIEGLDSTNTATVTVDDIYDQIESLNITAAATISSEDIRKFPTIATPWTGQNDNKLYLQSGQFSSTVKTSLNINAFDGGSSDISWDGTNTPWCGLNDDFLYLQSGQFTSTLKTSRDISAIDGSVTGISWDGINTPWCGQEADKLYLTSGQFTSTIKDSEDISAVDDLVHSISADGTNTPWCGIEADKLYLTSGQFTSTIKTSQSVSAVDRPTGISWDGTNTPWIGGIDKKLYLQSGQFTSTLKTSEDISAIEDTPTGISTNAFNSRIEEKHNITITATTTVEDIHVQIFIEDLDITITSAVSIDDQIGSETPWTGTQTDKLYLQSGTFTSTLKTSEDVSAIDNVPLGISWDGTNTPWSGSQADKLYLTSGQFTSTIKTSQAIVGFVPQDISWDGTNTPTTDGDGFDSKLYLISGQFTSTIKTSQTFSGTDDLTNGISYDGTNTPVCGQGTDKLYLVSGQFSSTIKDSEDVSGLSGGGSPKAISYDGEDTLWMAGVATRKLILQSGQFTSTIKQSQSVFAFDDSPTGIETNRINARLGI